MKVKNLNGTSQNICKCGSWLQHWKNFGSSMTDDCVANGCSNKAEVGGHVKMGNPSSMGWYIVPLCKSCNGKLGQELYIADNTELVSANISETCGKVGLAGLFKL